MSKGGGVASRRSERSPSELLLGMAQRVSPRVGEGQQVQLHQIARSNDGKSVTFGADLSKAPVPARRYAADICDVLAHRNDIVFVFGQESVISGVVDSVLQLRMNPTCARDFLLSLASSSNTVFDDVVAALKVNSEPLTTVTTKPSKEAKAQVTYASVAIAGFDTCIDFYSASAFGIGHLKRTGDLFVEPVARVDLHTALFLSMISKMRELVPTLSHLPEGEENE